VARDWWHVTGVTLLPTSKGGAGKDAQELHSERTKLSFSALLSAMCAASAPAFPLASDPQALVPARIAAVAASVAAAEEEQAFNPEAARDLAPRKQLVSAPTVKGGGAASEVEGG
jgi:hypothetical protein